MEAERRELVRRGTEVRVEGYILPDGTVAALDDTAMLVAWALARGDAGEARGLLGAFAEEATRAGLHPAARTYYQAMEEVADNAAQQAVCLLHAGLAMERHGDFAAAAEDYLAGLALGEAPAAARYFLHNNLGYSLNHLGRHDEAAAHCRAAITIDPARHNAHKNLGVALEGLGRHADAARSYFRATLTNANDVRARLLLEALLARDSALLRDAPDVAQAYARMVTGGAPGT